MGVGRSTGSGEGTRSQVVSGRICNSKGVIPCENKPISGYLPSIQDLQRLQDTEACSRLGRYDGITVYQGI